jgi:hypothetical protein
MSIRSPLPGWLSTYHFSSKLIVFCLFFTWIALGDVNLHFSLVLVRKTSAVEEETTGGLTVMSLSLTSNRK